MGKRRTARGWRLVALACGLTAGGCATPTDALSEEASPAGREFTHEARAPMDLVWSTDGVRFATGPQAVLGRDLVVALAVDGDGLALVAYDSATGDERWRRPSTASYVTRGVTLTPLIDGGTVVHVAQDPEGLGDVVEAVDAVTGEVEWASPPASEGFSDPPRLCTGEARDGICVTAGGAGEHAGQWKLDHDTGELTRPGPPIETLVRTASSASSPGQSAIDGRYLGLGLYELSDSGEIALIVDGEILWQRPPSELFGGADVSPDFGWTLYPTGDGLIVGTLGAVVDLPQDGERELADAQTAGIDAITGTTRWLEPGWQGCGRLASLRLTVDGVPPWVRCDWDASAWFEDDRPQSYTVERSVMYGFDPANGAASWTVDLGRTSALLDPEGFVVRLDRTAFAVTRDDGSLVGVDVGTGEELAVDDHDVGWCFETNFYPYQDADRVGADLAHPCNLAGEAQPAPLRSDDAVGVLSGGVFVWMDGSGLHGATNP